VNEKGGRLGLQGYRRILHTITYTIKITRREKKEILINRVTTLGRKEEPKGENQMKAEYTQQ